MRRTFFRLVTVCCAAAILVSVAWLLVREEPRRASRPLAPAPASLLGDRAASSSAPMPLAASTRESRGYLVAEKTLARLRTPLAREKARANEAVLVFKDADALRRFLARAGAAGLRVLARMDGLHAVRVGFDSLAALEKDLAAHGADYADIDANYFVAPPEVPPTDPRFAGRFTPIGAGLFDFLGVSGDISRWGSGVTIAILDSGIASDPTFGANRVRYLDIGYGIAPFGDNGHGTAVASLAGGTAAEAAGIAQGASLLSLRVTGDDGLSDSFTLSRGVLAAIDAGAQIINISMGSYANSYVLTNAIDYATAHGAIIVASAGNDQAAVLTWPAADPRVVSVGAVDATEQQVVFSNAGEQLQISAPGFGLQAAWTNGERVSMDGTSGSAPLVAGSIAAMMSQNPGLTAAQAWMLLRQYSSDGGPPGPDPDFGAGILNLGWAMNRNDFNRVDPAVSSQYFDPARAEMQFVVQNRSARGVGGLTLNVSVGPGASTFSVPWLGPGGTYAVSVPVDYLYLQSYGRIDYRTQLINPPGIIDANPSNNSRTNIISLTRAQ